VCVSGICDTTNNQCGYANGNGPCTTDVQCQTGHCVASGGVCEPCATSADCSAPTPICDTSKHECVQCAAADSTACTGDSPLCDPSTGPCVPCNGDAGSGAAHQCPTGTPVCTSSGACIACKSNADCSGPGHAGPRCDTASGACVVGCAKDSDCPNAQFCNT